MKHRGESVPAAGSARDAKIGWNDAPLDWPRQSGHVEQLKAALELRKKRQRRRRVQVAVGSAVAMMIAVLGWQISLRQGASLPAISAGRAIVSIPERRVLPDSSIVELKEGSEIAVDYSGALRRVVLRRGEAHFQVAKNPARAFVVEAGGVEFRAVGTAFAVGLRTGSVEMIVTEGRVAVDPAATGQTGNRAMVNGGTPSAPIVEAGNRVVVEISARAPAPAPPVVLPVSAALSSQILAWRVPRLEFNETPLSEAVAAINRLSRWRLMLADAALGRVEISGALRADNVEPLLRMLESNFNIRSELKPDGEIVLRQGAAPAASR